MRNLSYFQSVFRNISWWRHQMVKFSVLLALCAGNSSVTGELCLQRPVTRSFHAFFDLRRNSWVNNRDTVDLRRYPAHYDVTEVHVTARETNGCITQQV